MLSSSESIKCSVCSRIHTAITDPESGEVICSNCGFVLAEKDPELDNMDGHAFATEESYKRARAGAPISTTRYDKGLATVIGKISRDAHGRSLDSNMHSTFKRLKTWDTRTQLSSPTAKNLQKAFFELEMLKDKLGLSDALIEITARIYRKVEGRGLVRGRTIPGMLAAAVYVACRETGTPRTLKDLAKTSNIKRKHLARSIRLLTFELGINAPIFDPMKCIIRIGNSTNVTERTRRRAFKIMNELLRRKTFTSGKDPMGLAATILYLACEETREYKTQNELAKAAGVSAATIRNGTRYLEKNLNLLSVK
jgi:transcription initiation factor TFIIB